MGNLVALIQETVPLRRVGDLWHGRCPACDADSFRVNEAKSVYHCYSCSMGGGLAGWTAYIRKRQAR